MRILIAALALTLAGCATAPRLAGEGVLPVLAGRAVTLQGGQATPSGPDAALARAIETRVMARLVAGGADASGAKAPVYLVQVAVAAADPAVGVATAVGPQPAWRSAPVRLRPWSRRGPNRTATLVVLDVATGKPAAWAGVRTSSADPTDLAERLVTAVTASGKG
ncbi:hypothetical protein [Caulobacter sp. LARHSG274]